MTYTLRKAIAADAASQHPQRTTAAPRTPTQCLVTASVASKHFAENCVSFVTAY